MSREARCPLCGVPLGTPHHPACVDYRRSTGRPSPEWYGDDVPDVPTQEEDE